MKNYRLLIVLIACAIMVFGIVDLTESRATTQPLYNEVIPLSMDATIRPLELAEYQATYIGEFYITAYCAGFEPCEVCGTDGITASGTECKPYGSDYVTVAVDKNIIPLGTILELQLESGEIIHAVAEDVGGAIDGKRIDICFYTHQEAINFGVQFGKVRVVL
jgi:3D (Asp-Asp-Asp) domain-containing protein